MRISEIEEQARSFPSRKNGMKFREYEARPRVYFSIEDETILQNFVNRFSRPSKIYRDLIGVKIFELFGVDPAESKLTWSQKAGCSCGCSPGLILSTKINAGLRKSDVFVTISGDDASVDPAKQEVINNRSSAIGYTQDPAEDLFQKMKAAGKL